MPEDQDREKRDDSHSADGEAWLKPDHTQPAFSTASSLDVMYQNLSAYPREDTAVRRDEIVKALYSGDLSPILKRYGPMNTERQDTHRGPGTSIGAGKSTDWRDVKDRLERLRDQGAPYVSQGDLAERLNCSKTTVYKAIHASPKLKAWMATARNDDATLRATRLNGVVIDRARQSVEAEPADVPPDDEVDAVMAKLIEQAKPKERAELNALDAEDRRVLVKTYYAQNRDNEPSPFDNHPPDWRVKQHKRV